jgi:uncharacterized protein DUF4232
MAAVLVLSACQSAAPRAPAAANRVQASPTPEPSLVPTPIATVPAAPSPPPAVPVAPPVAPPVASGPDRCHTAGLRISFATQWGAAGTIYDYFGIGTIGPRPCTLYGSVGMLMLDSAGRPLPTHVIRRDAGGANGPSLVLLNNDYGAAFQASWSDVPRGPAHCPAASRLEITPPDEFDHVVIPVTGWNLAPCAGGQIFVSPVGVTGV